MTGARFLLAAAAVLLADGARADALTGPVTRQPLNPMAIAMFLGFVAITLAITVRAARSGT